MDNIHAAIGRVQLTKLDEFTEKRCQIASWYDELLPEIIQRPVREPHSEHCFHLYQVLLPNELKRDPLVECLKDWNIDAVFTLFRYMSILIIKASKINLMLVTEYLVAIFHFRWIRDLLLMRSNIFVR